MYTLPEIAAYTNIEYNLLYYYVKKGRILKPKKSLGKIYYYENEDLKKVLTQLKILQQINKNFFKKFNEKRRRRK